MNVSLPVRTRTPPALLTRAGRRLACEGESGGHRRACTLLSLLKRVCALVARCASNLVVPYDGIQHLLIPARRKPPVATSGATSIAIFAPFLSPLSSQIPWQLYPVAFARAALLLGVKTLVEARRGEPQGALRRALLAKLSAAGPRPAYEAASPTRARASGFTLGTVASE
jgi:hypothetical protein